MKIKKFLETLDTEKIDPYGEEDWDDKNLVKPELKEDYERLSDLYMYMERTMQELADKSIFMEDEFTTIYEKVFDKVIWGLYGDEGIDFINKAWKL